MIRTAFEDNPEKAMSKALETEFDEAMMGVYRQALSECDYKATRFLHMLHEHRATVSEGYIACRNANAYLTV